MSYQGYKDTVDKTLFSEMKPEEEKLLPIPDGASHEWSETSMFGFNIPEEGIDCIIYFWHRPVMNISFGGIMIWKGKNTNQVECIYSDYRSAMPMPKDITDCTYANGVTVKMIEPMSEFQIGFEDSACDVKLDLHLKAIMPPACRYNGGHITQAMKTSGTLLLRGKRYTINGFHTRDRSWNEYRQEYPLKVPPLHWDVGIVDETFAFHHLSYDDPAYHPEWKGKVPEINNTCLWGYVYENGQLHGVVSTRQRTDYEPGGTVPIHIETTLTASNGKSYEIVGRPLASTQVQSWPNMCSHFVLMEWSVDGRIAYGDVQSGLFHDSFRLLTGKED